MISRCIGQVQTAEKDKLTFVAAHHLDQLKSTVLSSVESSITGSRTEQQVQYLQEQIVKAQASIAEAVENIQCCLCDLED